MMSDAMNVRYCACHKSDRGCDEPCLRSRHYRGDDLTITEAAKWRAGRDACVSLLTAEAARLRVLADSVGYANAVAMGQQAAALEAAATRCGALEPGQKPEPIRSRDNFYDVSSLRGDMTGLHARGG